MGLLRILNTQALQKILEFAGLVRRHLYAHQHPARIAAPVIAVVEQADVPARAHLRKKMQQRPRNAREIQTEYNNSSVMPGAWPPTM